MPLVQIDAAMPAEDRLRKIPIELVLVERPGLDRVVDGQTLRRIEVRAGSLLIELAA